MVEKMKFDRSLGTVEQINLTDEEKKAFEVVENVLLQLQFEFDRQADLTSLHTGEVISMNEIPRIRGFLGCLQENWCYTMEINNKGGR